MNTAIQTKKLSHSFGDNPVLNHLSFSIPKGDFFTIIGPNGSGKTTLLKVISGIYKLQKGQLAVMDQPIDQYSRKELAKTILFVPQMVLVDFPFTVTEIILMGRSPYLGVLGLEEKKDMEIAEQAVAFTGLWDMYVESPESGQGIQLSTNDVLFAPGTSNSLTTPINSPSRGITTTTKWL